MKKIFALLMVVVFCISLGACSFTSNKLSSVSLSETDLTLSVGDSKNLTVTAEPEKAQTGVLTWSSVNSSIARVDNGTIVAVAAGNTVVTVTTEDGLTASCNVKVIDKEIESIMLNQISTSVKVNSRIQIEAKVSPPEAPSNNLKWSSSDDSIATVNSEGYVTGVKAGTVNIFCTAENNVEASCTVTVKDPDATNNNNNNNSNNTNNNSSNGNNTTIIYKYPSDYTYSDSGFIFPDSSSRKLSSSEVAYTLSNMYGYSPANSYAQDAINEIYARNGYVFKSAELRNYYESKSWYYANPYFSTSDFTAIEKYNMSLFEQYS